MKTKFFSTFILALLLTFFVPAVYAQTPCVSQAGGHCVNLAAAGISGLEFLDVKDTSPGGVIEAVYKFGMEIVGVAALIVFVAAGITYLTAGDNEKRVKQAQTWMGNAIFGLVLALVSYLILNTINPALVQKLNIGLEPLKYSPSQPGINAPIKTKPTPYDQQLAGPNSIASDREELDSLQKLLQDKKITTDQQIDAARKKYAEWQANFDKLCKERGGAMRKDASNPNKVILVCNMPKK